ncbi:hypothetical protein GGR50DRAFT_693461 [Xylaria sp. CBS 124048]|nr:hypothetical protein GGR50DRAFT_693461 [Xylaria sp. CBS 124048]
MRTRSSSKTNPPPVPQATPSDIPSPLHIIKRTKTVEFHPRTRREISNSSVDYGPDQPLNVAKKRQRRGPASEETHSTRTYEDQAVEVQPTRETASPMPSAVTASQVRQPSKPQSRLSWFSRQRASTSSASSGTTCRRYNLRGSSMSSHGSSIGRLPSSEYVEEADSEPFESRSSMQIDTSILSTPAPPIDDCHLLVPRISITPEVEMSNNAISMAWVAIEISVQLSRPYHDTARHPYVDESLVTSPPRAGSVSRFGYIYDLQVDVLPVPQTVIIQVLQDNNKKSLSLGSTMLVLARIQIDRRRLTQASKPTAPKPDELIADIEKQLGAALFKCLQVRLRYKHSGFAALDQAVPTAGTMDYQTRLETTVSGVIEQQALRPFLRSPRAGTDGASLFDIVASYWGPVRANEIFHCGAAFRQGNRNAGTVTRNNVITTTAPVTSVQQYGASTVLAATQQNIRFRADPDPSTPVARRQGKSPPPPPPRSESPDLEDPAHRIWTAMRRRSSHMRRPSLRSGNVGSLFHAATTAGGGTPTFSEKAATITASSRMRGDVDRRRDLIRDVALRNQRSIGMDSLKSLVPSMMSLEMNGNGGGSAQET